MANYHINQIVYCFVFCCIFGCISQNQLSESDFEKKHPNKTQHDINKNKESCHLTENKPRSSWIDQLPQSNGQLFGMGVAPKQHPISRQIQAAKNLAMRDISQQINVHVKSLYQEKITSNQAPEIQSHIELKAEALLQGVKIIDQWNDLSTCDIYMLVSVDIDSDENYNDTKIDDLKQPGKQKRVELKPIGIISNIQSEGSCVIQGISPRQAQTIAIQRARALAIDKASGIEIHASKIVSDSMLVLDFIRSYSKGYIVREKVNWHPVRQYQRNSETPPVVEHHVSIVADVYIPQKKGDNIGLEVSLNKSVFNKGERAVLRIKTRKTCQVGIFNIQANDRIVMLFPSSLFPNKTVFSHEPFEMKNLYPEPLPQEQSNYEALFVCASLDDAIDFQSLFSVDEQMEFSEFFRRYATISDECTDILIPYQVVDSHNEK
ncbi:hypothetical protein MHK_004975 [Candidatus Magnetomorum sp. HK-1]|nr:hypothetical protein MHK_004975 [Candidatus Magnetomorum sp. HK-1]